jgi:hypothetical protein
MVTTTENEEKGLPLENAERATGQQVSGDDFRPWQHIPVFIAMGLAIFILGLVRVLVSHIVAKIC